MMPSLPQQDPNQDARKSAIARGKQEYQFTWDYHQIACAVDVPLRDKSDPRYYAALAAVGARLEANKVATKLAPKKSGIARYDQLYELIPAPPITKLWERDDVFAWQAVAGTNPVMLERLRGRLAKFPITDAQYARAVPGDTFDKALAEGRLYIADYALLDGLAEGSTKDGLKKFNFAPIALYAWRPGGLVAAAIQVAQQPGSPIFTPQDGTSWKMARATVSTADGNYQGILSHFALCHQVMEAVILSARRTLAPNHPVRVLLEPHFENTLITNSFARENLIGDWGYMQRLQSPTLEASLTLAAQQIRAFDITKSAPTREFARRGVDDVATLGDYPCRDDGLLVWHAMVPFVEAYVRLYYTSAADVSGDTELAAWIDEMSAESGGRMSGLSRLQTVDAVVDLLAQILFRCTAHHAMINYSSFDLFSYPPNVQTAAFGPGPTGTAADTEDAFLAMLPPFDCGLDGLTLFYEITVQLNRLGHYPSDHFVDVRVADLITAYQARLDDVEKRIADRDATRLVSYPYQRPSRVTQSIHV